MGKTEANNKIRVVHIIPTLNYGGIGQMLYSFYKATDRNRFEFYFIHFGGREEFHGHIEDMGGRIFTIPSIHKSGYKAYKNSLKELLQGECKTDIVHIHANYMSGVVGAIAKSVGVTNRICHIRGVLIEGAKRHLMPIYRFLIKKNCTEFLAVSKESGRFYYGNNFPFTVINNGLDYQLFQSWDPEETEKLKREYNIDKNRLVIGQIGRLAKEKNHSFSLRLTARLKEKGLNPVLLVAGEGDERERITAGIKEMGLEENVFLLGNRGDIQNIYHICNITLLPSYSEGMPNVVLQSQCAGRRCFVSDCITRDVDLGLGLVDFCTLNSVEEWATAIVGACQEERTVGKETVYNALLKNNFLLEGEVKRLENMYETMAKGTD